MTARAAETFWRQAHDRHWVAGYAASCFSPARSAYGAAMRRLPPFRTVLDLGCNCGPSMPWILAAQPLVAVTGVDVNLGALRQAEADYPAHVWILESAVDFLPWADLRGQRWDVGTSSSCLAHVAPADIVAVLAGLARVAISALVLQEVTCSAALPNEGLSPAGVQEWRYDYPRRMAALGWRMVERTGHDETGPRPGAVMVFRREGL